MRGTIVVMLLACAAATAVAGSRWLPRASWPLRAPRAAIAIWQAATLSMLASVVAAGVILAVPCWRISTDPAVLRACLAVMRAQYATPDGALAGAAGTVLVVGALGRITWCTGTAMAGARRRRARHDDVLAIIARPGPAGVQVIDDEHPAVYCLPGRGRIVLTTGALRCLDGRQLEAVLAHERAHLSGRHHLVLTFASALKEAFPAAGFFAIAARQISELIEVAADDAAIRRAPRLTLAGALLAVAAAGSRRGPSVPPEPPPPSASGASSTRPAGPAQLGGRSHPPPWPPYPFWCWQHQRLP